MTERRRPVAADVAKAVGVSKTTVSYVFSAEKRHKISAETVERVLAEADRIGFRPNRTARALRTGNRNSVLAVIPDWDMGPGWSVIIQALSDILAERGVAFSAVDTSAASGPLWGDLVPGAVIAISDVSRELAVTCASEGVPLVDAGTREMLSRAGYEGSRALHAAGHERLGYILPPPPASREIWEYRFEGIKAYCRDAGLAEPLRGSFDFTAEGVSTLREEWLEGGARISGIIAHNDEVGTFYYIALRDAGFDTRTIGIIGAADRPISRLGLTTITSEAVDDAAHRIANSVLAALAAGSAERSVVSWGAPVIIYRDSLPRPDSVAEEPQPDPVYASRVISTVTKSFDP